VTYEEMIADQPAAMATIALYLKLGVTAEECAAAAAAPQRSMTIRRIDFVKLSIFTVMSILTASGSIPDDPSTSASGFGS